MAWRKDLPESLKTKVRDFFLTYGKTPAEKEKLAKFKWSAFRPSDNNQLIPIRELEIAKKKKLDELTLQLDALKKTATK